MRRALSTIFRLSGFVLGLAAAGLLIALQWSDVIGDLHNVKALRHIVLMFTSGMMFGGLIGWHLLVGGREIIPGKP
jgi:hypothetical protein